jgi:hypothetical protein
LYLLQLPPFSGLFHEGYLTLHDGGDSRVSMMVCGDDAGLKRAGRNRRAERDA